MTKKCQHDYKEDPMFADGVITLVTGTPKDLGEETMVVCSKCGDAQYVRVKDLGSLTDLLEERV